MNNLLNHVIGAVVSAIVALVVVFSGAHFIPGIASNSVGGSGRAYDVDASYKSITLAASSTGAVRDGSNWTINGIGEGTCNLSQANPGSHVATSSMEYYCAFTGARSGDTVIVTLPPGSGPNVGGAGSIFGGFVVGSAYATTSNRIGVQIINNTGTATSSFAQATTTAHVLIVR